MLPIEVENYLQEISRVLRPEGRCFATFFLLNETSKQQMFRNKAFFFPHDFGYYRLMDKKVKSANVAFEEAYLKDQLIANAGLQITHITYGYWCGRPKEKNGNFQDILILAKA
jgi:ubiquinone/menaquinone biosynthesis C-methylase UbiE